MSHHNSPGRDRSARRGENNGRNDPPRPHVSLNIEINNDGDEHSSGLPPPSETHLRAHEEPIYITTPPPLAFPSRPSDARPHHPERTKLSFVRRRPPRASRDHPDRAHDFKINDEYIEKLPSKEDMPSIQQNYRPRSPRPSSEPYVSNIAMASGVPPVSVGHTRLSEARKKRKRLHHPHITSVDSSEVGGGGGGGGGDIQTSAAKKARLTPRTLNSIVICVYRNSRRKFEQRRVWLVKKEHRHEEHPLTSHLRTDTAFFNEIRYRYKNQLRGTFRRYISFKTVSIARILEYGSNRFGLANVNPKLFSPIFMKAYKNPDGTLLDPKKHPHDPDITPNDWIIWFWKNRRQLVAEQKVDLAIELVEDYDSTRVMGAIAMALLVYFTLTIVWLAKGGDPGYVAGVMSFVLSILAVMVGLTGLYDLLDLGNMGGGKDFLVLDREDFVEARGNGWSGPTPGDPYRGRLSGI